jgi:hypothetical protein
MRVSVRESSRGNASVVVGLSVLLTVYLSLFRTETTEHFAMPTAFGHTPVRKRNGDGKLLPPKVVSRNRFTLSLEGSEFSSRREVLARLRRLRLSPHLSLSFGCGSSPARIKDGRRDWRIPISRCCRWMPSLRTSRRSCVDGDRFVRKSRK